MTSFPLLLDPATLDVVSRVSTSSSHSNAERLLLLLLLAGFVFYGAVFLKYRNVNKRYHYESEANAEIAHVQPSDSFARSLHGLRNSHMSGANNHDVRGAGATAGVTSVISQLGSSLSSLGKSRAYPPTDAQNPGQGQYPGQPQHPGQQVAPGQAPSAGGYPPQVPLPGEASQGYPQGQYPQGQYPLPGAPRGPAPPPGRPQYPPPAGGRPPQ